MLEMNSASENETLVYYKTAGINFCVLGEQTHVLSGFTVSFDSSTTKDIMCLFVHLLVFYLKNQDFNDYHFFFPVT